MARLGRGLLCCVLNPPRAAPGVGSGQIFLIVGVQVKSNTIHPACKSLKELREWVKTLVNEQEFARGGNILVIGVER